MIKEQQVLDEWFKAKGWPYWSPHEILARLMEETGEFARLVNHEYGPKKKKDGEATQDFEDELGDILYTLACFANTHHIDLDSALARSLEKVAGRDKDRF
ncbi:nucleotide pyrophosphohydrolase [Patescibacteria group bacterium]|nr:nucleotide pyrophosphohydrolase [Patescibacteria group bacterium]